jgi:hypothetical protein
MDGGRWQLAVGKLSFSVNLANVAVDEDRIGDDERRHTDEQVTTSCSLQRVHENCRNPVELRVA